jgi:hypothetical protein
MPLQLLHQATAGMVVAAPAAAYAAFLEAASALHEGDVAMALNTAGAQAVNSANHSSTTARFSMGLPITDDGSASDDPYDDEEEEEEGNEGQHHGHVREAMQGSSHHEGSKVSTNTFEPLHAQLQAVHASSPEARLLWRPAMVLAYQGSCFCHACQWCLAVTTLTVSYTCRLVSC